MIIFVSFVFAKVCCKLLALDHCYYELRVASYQHNYEHCLIRIVSSPVLYWKWIKKMKWNKKKINWKSQIFAQWTRRRDMNGTKAESKWCYLCFIVETMRRLWKATNAWRTVVVCVCVLSEKGCRVSCGSSENNSSSLSLAKRRVGLYNAICMWLYGGFIFSPP